MAKLTRSNKQPHVYGIHAVQAVLEFMPWRAQKLLLARDHPKLETIAHLASKKNIKKELADKRALDHICGDAAVHQGAVLLAKPFIYTELDTILAQNPSLLLVLDGVEDPRNLGRAGRSALSFGANALIIPQDGAASITPAAEKAAVGAFAQLPVARVGNLQRALTAIKEHGIVVVGTLLSAAKNLPACDFTQPIAIVVGNEESGLRHTVAQACDFHVRIPTANNTLSLNAADAATICLYEAWRQRI